MITRHIHNYFLIYTYLYFILIFGCENGRNDYKDNRELKSKVELINSKKNGIYKEYFSNGNLKSKTNWKDNLQDGEGVFYYENGDIKSIAYWKSNRFDSTSKLFYSNGRLENIANFKNGVLHGEHTSYFPNGNIKQNGFYREGISYGILKNYFNTSSNKVASIDYFLNIHGKEKNMGFIEYNLDGTIKKSTTRLNIKAEQDTIGLGEELKLKIIVEMPKYNSSKLIIGPFDEKFYVTDKTLLDTFDIINNSIIYRVKTQKKGHLNIRGLVENYGIISKSLKTTKVAVIERYFEYPIFID